MSALYQRGSRPSELLPALLVAGALLLVACTAEAPTARESPAVVPPGRPPSLETLLASRSHTAIEWSADGSQLLVAASDGRTLLFRPPDTAAVELLRDPDVRPVALLPVAESFLAEVRELAGARFRRLFRVERQGRRSPLPLPEGDSRFHGWSADRASFLVGVTDADQSAALFDCSSTSLACRFLVRYPPQFEVAAASRDSRRVALRRELHPEADELYLDDRDRGEIRLLLPDGPDARFRPVAFTPDSQALLLLTDEGRESLHLEWLDLERSTRRPLPESQTGANGCESASAALSQDGRQIAVETVCAGAREARLYDAESDSLLALGPGPVAERRVALLSMGQQGPELSTFASSRTPRDLLFRPADARSADGAQLEVPQPLTWGLSPGVDPLTLVESTRPAAPRGDPARLPSELWSPLLGSAAGLRSGSAVLWVESDESPPRWNEFDPLFQFLATHGIAILRVRLRGSDGFGRANRHAADGRPLDAALEDLAWGLDLLAAQGVSRDRVALVGDGPWPGALATALARGAVNLPARGEISAPFVAVIALDAAPEPARRVLEVESLPEPARSWWITRLGRPSDAASRRLLAVFAASAAAEAEEVPSPIPLFAAHREPRADSDLWRFLASRLGDSTAAPAPSNRVLP